MENKPINKLALDQEVVKNLTQNERSQAGLFSKHCPPPSVGFPVCTPVHGAK